MLFVLPRIENVFSIIPVVSLIAMLHRHRISLSLSVCFPKKKIRANNVRMAECLSRALLIVRRVCMHRRCIGERSLRLRYSIR